jgi:hypothetical protein
MANRRQHSWTGWRLAVKLLEQPHMESVMKLGARWQLQLVGDITDPFTHLKGRVVLRTQHATAGDPQGGDWAVQQTEPDPIPRVELKLPMIADILKLVVVLCLLKPLTHLEEELVALCKLLVHRRQTRLIRRIGAQGRWLTVVDHLEQSRAKRGVQAGVVAVLRPSKPLEPLTRMVADETAKIHCYHLVYRLRLVIGLRMEGRGQV